MDSRYRPNVTVACVIHCQGDYLLVEEHIDGQIRYNQPAGHLEANESIINACIREVNEETGLEIKLRGLIGIYQFQATQHLAFLRFTFSAELEHKCIAIPLDPQIIAARWYNIQQIESMQDQLRSPLVLQTIQDHQSGVIHPLSLLNSNYLIAQS